MSTLKEWNEAINYQTVGWNVWKDVATERVRQVEKHGDHTDPNSILEQVDRSDPDCLAILVEEVGEVARAINVGDFENLETELIQTAAVCSAWVENMRRNS